MDIRKIAVVGGFAVGAALSFAPLASADTSTVDSEITLLNSIFSGEAALAGDSSDVVSSTTPGTFDTIPLADAPVTAPFTTLDYELYGVDPAVAGPASDPGSYNVFNGALTEFSDAYNVEAYSLANSGALDTNAADFIGSAGSIATGLGEANATDAFDYFWNFGIGDLGGFFDTNLSFLDLPL